MSLSLISNHSSAFYKKYPRKLWILLLVTAFIKIGIAVTVGLGNDEVYYYTTYATHLQYNYFDHPPLVGWLIRLTTINLWLHSTLFVRLGAIICSSISLLLIYGVAKSLAGVRAGWFAALLFNGSLYCSIIAGTFILPDSPQMLFWLSGIYLLVKIRQSGSNSFIVWVLFGVVAGLCIMSKVHGVFLWLAVGLFALFVEKRWLKQKGLYVAIVITLVIFSPVIIWNIQNHFITYTYHSGRVMVHYFEVNYSSLITELAGEIFYVNPFNWILICICLIRFFKNPILRKDRDVQLLLLCSLPLIIVVWCLAVFNPTLPHWSGPGYTGLLIVASVVLAKYPVIDLQKLPRLLVMSLGFAVLVVFGGISLIRFYPGTLSQTNDDTMKGQGDFTLDMYGWQKAGEQFAKMYAKDTTIGLMPRQSVLIIRKWFPAAHISYYIAPQVNMPVYAIGDTTDLHQYAWLRQYQTSLPVNAAAYYIIPSNLYEPDTGAWLKKYFNEVSAPLRLPQYRNQKLCRYFYVYRLTGYKGFYN